MKNKKKKTNWNRIISWTTGFLPKIATLWLKIPPNVIKVEHWKWRLSARNVTPRVTRSERWYAGSRIKMSIRIVRLLGRSTFFRFDSFSSPPLTPTRPKLHLRDRGRLLALLFSLLALYFFFFFFFCLLLEVSSFARFVNPEAPLQRGNRKRRRKITGPNFTAHVEIVRSVARSKLRLFFLLFLSFLVSQIMQTTRWKLFSGGTFLFRVLVECFLKVFECRWFAWKQGHALGLRCTGC